MWNGFEMYPVVPLPAYLIRPVIHLDPNPVGIEDEERVVAREVRFLLGRDVDPGAHVQASPVGLVDLGAAVDRKGEVFDPHSVVPVLATVSLPQAESGLGLAPEDVALTKPEVDHLLGSTIGLKPPLHLQAERTEHAEVEVEGAVEILDREIDVVEAFGHSSSSVIACAKPYNHQTKLGNLMSYERPQREPIPDPIRLSKAAISGTESEAVAEAFENAKALLAEGSSVTLTDIAGTGFEPVTSGL
ncbi:MAG: hypothetical protein R2718_04265 [Solirubrobacterales bacterium]